MISNFFYRRLIHPVKLQLLQGISPRSLALACALGVGLGAFPLFGTTTGLCLIVGVSFKLNQPVLQAVNYLMSPFQLLGIPFFARYGCIFTGSPMVSINPQQILNEFHTDMPMFLAKYGWIGLHAILAWALIIPWVALVVYGVSFLAFKRWSQNSQSKEVSNSNP
jgi:uncharacterized protein (DUF2062 family)